MANVREVHSAAPAGSCGMCMLFDKTSQKLLVTFGSRKSHRAEATESSMEQDIYIQWLRIKLDTIFSVAFQWQKSITCRNDQANYFMQVSFSVVDDVNTVWIT